MRIHCAGVWANVLCVRERDLCERVIVLFLKAFVNALHDAVCAQVFGVKEFIIRNV